MPSPTITPTLLLSRLDAIGRAVRDTGEALALIGLGSCGLDSERLDAHSDLDFFVIVQAGRKRRFLDRLDWLAAAWPLAWHFQNTSDGHKALMDDGVFCEFAVFEPDELGAAVFAPGRVVWRRDDVDETIALPRRSVAGAGSAPPSEEWIVGEALSNLFVGLQRWHRGERLSAARFVQGYAVDRLLQLDDLRVPADRSSSADPFNADRRAEQRHPALAGELGELVPGYAHTPAAALAMLRALESRGVTANAAVVSCIRELAARACEQ